MMNNRIIITFDKSQEDIPVLLVGRENNMAYLTGGPSLIIDNMFTGDKATEIWDTLNKKEKVVMENG